MSNFVFTHGDMADGPLSVACTVRGASNLEEAKGILTDLLAEIEVEGAPPGVVTIAEEDDIQLQVRITPEAVANDDNWEEDE